MSVIAAENPGLAIWKRTVQPSRRTLDPAAARALLQFRLTAGDQRRAGQLAEKASAGKLTGAEARELENYRSIGTALEFMKSKARHSLASAR